MSTLTKDPSGTSYRYAPASNIEVEVGDALQSDFYPQVKLKRWDNECNFSLRFQLPGGGRAGVSTADTKIIWERGDYRAIFYDAPEASNEGGFEFEIHLGKKPPSNSFSFSCMSKDVEFLYQPPLTQEESATIEIEGQQVPIRIRPPNVVGSYAVYSKSKRNGQYGTGKVCHIYRPHAVDAAGKETWGTISISSPGTNGDGTVTLALPQDWLNSATYPVVIDPTFGYSSAGASEWFVPGNNLFMMGGTPAGAGTGDSISCHGYAWTSADGQGALALQSNDTIVSNGLTWTYSMPSGSGNKGWTTMAFQTTKPSVSAVGHWVCAVWSYYFYLSYDGGSGDGAIDSSSSYPNPPNPTDKSTSANRFSLKCDYTASAASAARRLTLLGVG